MEINYSLFLLWLYLGHLQLLLQCLLLLVNLLHDLLIEERLLLLFDLCWLRLLGRAAPFVALVHHRKDYACHLAALERVVGSDHVKVRERLLMQSRLVELDLVDGPPEALLLLYFLQGAQQYYKFYRENCLPF